MCIRDRAVDHADTTTGISAAERSYTIMKCVDDQSKPEDFRRPGHVLSLIHIYRSILNEFGLAVFVVSASLVLKLGIATVALVGAVLLMQGSLSAVSYTHLGRRCKALFQETKSSRTKACKSFIRSLIRRFRIGIVRQPEL